MPDRGAIIDNLGLGVSAFNPFSNPPIGQTPIRADYRILGIFDSPVKGQGTRLEVLREDLMLSGPVWNDECNEVGLTARVHSEQFATHAVLPDTGQPFPDELWDVRFGVNYRHVFDNGWTAGGTVSFGSASDKPFHSDREMTEGVNAFLRVPQGEQNAWLFSVTYSSNSQLPIPIPGVAFVWQPNEYFHANIGLPFLVMYRPTDDLTLDFSYMLLTNVHARATYRLFDPLRVYAGYDWSNEGFFLADRADAQDRFFSYEQRVSAGVFFPLGKHSILDFSGGYVFDRYYFEGHSFNASSSNRVDVGDNAFLAMQVRTRW